MIKILIADDEEIFRDYIGKEVNWESYGFEICCEAKNGMEALELARLHKPDIALLDINMPKINGLELSSKLLQEIENISIVLITGYSEFEYAKKALKLGVVDYIVKPFEIPELVLTLLKLKDNIIKAYEDRIDNQVKEQLLRDTYINQLLNQSYGGNEQELLDKLNSMGLFKNMGEIMVTAIETDNLDQQWEKTDEKMLWGFAVINILKEIIQPEGQHIIINDYTGRIISIIEYSDTINMDEDIDGYKKLTLWVNKHLDFTITTGIGSLKSNVNGMCKSYKEALEALRYKIIMGNNRVLKYEEISKTKKNLVFYSTQLNEELISQMRANNIENAKTALKKIFDITNNNQLSVENIKIIHLAVVSQLLSFIIQSGRNIADIFGIDFYPFDEIQSAKRTVDKEQIWITNLVEIIVQYFSENKVSRASQITNQAKEFIISSYFKSDLSVTQIAKKLYVNQTYLRSMFKKETGLNVNEYINNVRMNMAMELISKGNLKLSDIALEVGFCDSAYFSKSFKKHYGISPSTFRILSDN